MSAKVQIALLRGVMPTGRTKVPMAQLRALLEDLGFTGVRTLLATGNAVFASRGSGGAELESLLEREIAARIGPKLDVMVRDAAAWARIVKANPFPKESGAMPGRVVATVFKAAPTAAQARAFEAMVQSPELAKVVGDVAWLVHPDGISATALKTADWKRAFGKFSATARNWNTVQKIQALAAEVADA